VSLDIQILTMGFMFVSGIALGVMYDIFRIGFKLMQLARWVMPLIDLVYWIVATLFVFRVLYYSNLGQVRVFVFIALLIGLSFYFALLSGWVIRLLLFIIRLTKEVIRFLKRIFHIFVVKPVIFLYRGLVILFGFIAVLSVYLGKIVLQLLYPFWFLVRPFIRWLKKTIPVPQWLARTLQQLKNWLKHLFDFIGKWRRL